MTYPQPPDDYGRYQPDQPYPPPPQQPYQPYQIQYQPPPGAGYGSPAKPGAVLTIAIMAIIDAVISGLSGIVWILTICGAPLGIYSIVVAVLAGIYAYKLLQEPPQPLQPNKTLAILQIVNIITGNIFSLVFGIVSLVLYNQPEVQAYFAYRNSAANYPTNYQPPRY